jgi:DNA-binding LacI/PurR family transcriptional regulator
VAQPHEEKGRLATEWLLEAIERGGTPQEAPQQAILPTELVVRDSTGPVKGKGPG